jgi:hypothetical protein
MAPRARLRRLRKVQRRREAEEDSCEQRDTEREEQHAGIQQHGRARIKPRNIAGMDRQQRRESRRAEQQPANPAEPRQQQALRHQLRRDLPASGSDRRADGDLAASAEGARQQQIGHVGARDQQQAAHRGQQHQQRRTDVASDILDQRLRSQRGLRSKCGRILAPELVGGHAQRGARLRQTHTRPQTRRAINQEGVVSGVRVGL